MTGLTTARFLPSRRQRASTGRRRLLLVEFLALSLFFLPGCGARSEETEHPVLVVRYPSDVVYGITAVACSPDGTRVASSPWPDGRINIWDLQKIALVRDLRYHRRAVLSMCFSADGEMLASASDDGQVCLWNGRTGTLKTLRGPINCNGWASGLRISPSGRYLVYNFTWNPEGHWHTETVVYDMLDDAEEVVLKGHYLPAFLPEDVLLTAVVPKEGVPPWGHSDCLIQFRKLGRKEEPETLFNEPLEVSAVASAPASRAVALGSYGEVRILTLPDKRLIKVVGHRFGDVRSLVFSPDAKRLAVVNEHSAIWLIDIQSETGQSQVVPLGHGGPVAFAPDSSFLIVGSEAVQLRDPSGQRVRVFLQALPWTDKPEWAAFTPLGYFKKSAGAGAFLKWRVKGESAPFEVHAEAYDRPELVSRALGRKQ